MKTYIKKQFNHVKKHYKQSKTISIKRIGIEVSSINKKIANQYEQINQSGVIITKISKMRAADRAALRVGDIINKINNIAINNIEDFNNAIEKIKSERKIILKYTRHGKGTIPAVIRF